MAHAVQETGKILEKKVWFLRPVGWHLKKRNWKDQLIVRLISYYAMERDGSLLAFHDTVHLKLLSSKECCCCCLKWFNVSHIGEGNMTRAFKEWKFKFDQYLTPPGDPRNRVSQSKKVDWRWREEKRRQHRGHDTRQLIRIESEIYLTIKTVASFQKKSRRNHGGEWVRLPLLLRIWVTTRSLHLPLTRLLKSSQRRMPKLPLPARKQLRMSLQAEVDHQLL